MIVGFGVRETENADVGAKSIERIKGLESVLSEDSTPSDFPKGNLGFWRELKPNSFGRERGWRESGGRGEYSKIEKEPQEDKDQSLGSGLKG